MDHGSEQGAEVAEAGGSLSPVSFQTVYHVSEYVGLVHVFHYLEHSQWQI